MGAIRLSKCGAAAHQRRPSSTCTRTRVMCAAKRQFAHLGPEHYRNTPGVCRVLWSVVRPVSVALVCAAVHDGRRARARARLSQPAGFCRRGEVILKKPSHDC